LHPIKTASKLGLETAHAVGESRVERTNTNQATIAQSLGSVIDSAPWSRYQKSVLLLVALAIITDGIATQIFGMAVPAIIKDWGVTRGDFALPTSLGFVGMALGAFIAGRAGERFGRRWPLIISVGLFGLMTLLSASATSMETLAAMRLASGLGLGGALPNATGLVADITPAQRRVFAISMGVIGMPLGNFICGMAGAAIVPTVGWRALFVTGGIVALAITLLLLLFLPESPRILLRDPSAATKLKTLLGKMGILVDPATFSADAGRTETDKAVLLSPRYRRDTLALWGAYVFTMLAIYTIVSWAPTLIAQQGFDLKVAGIGLSAFSAGSILGGFMMTFFVTRLGSKVPMALVAALGVGLALVLAKTPFTPAGGIALPVAALAALGFMVSGVQNMLYALAAHIYPPHMRASGLGTGLAVGRIGAIASGFTGAISLSQGTVTFFSVIALVFAAMLGAVLLFANPIPKRS
jgi:MFS transporter, AAHS family, 4-hydroxybenzoate transporter